MSHNLRFRVRLLGLFLYMSAFACGNREGARAPDSVPVSPTDSIPRRVITLAPNLTEMVYTLGAEDLLVGVTQYCKYPPEAREKPKVGALVNINYERILELEPDLVVLLPSHAKVQGELERLKIRTVTIRTESIADIYAGLERLGKILGHEEAARRGVEELKVKLSSVGARHVSGDSRAGPPPRVLLVVGRNPGTLQQIYACGSGNYLDEMIRLVGAVNALGETSSPWPVVSKEAILKMDPDVILDGSLLEGSAQTQDGSHMDAWKQLDSLGAVRKGRLVALRDEHLLAVGPGSLAMAGELEEMIFGAMRK